MEYKISINQLADFSYATESRKKSIIKQQKRPNLFLVPWYQLAKSRMKQSISRNGDLTPINNGIVELENRIPEKRRQIIDRQVSIEALLIFKEIKLPELFQGIPFEIIKPNKIKSIYMSNVEITISPDVVYRVIIDGQKYIGGVKLHVSKNNVFDSKQLKVISSLIFQYLNEVVVQGDEIVLEGLCISMDVFGKRVVSAPIQMKKNNKDIHKLCEEIKFYWHAA